MVLKLGTLAADITADTSGLNRAEADVVKSTGRINKQLKGVEKSAKGVSKGFKMAGRSAGQAGIQIQQFVGQLQGGQNAFVALSQQSADLGFVLGAPLVGVVVSLAAVIAGVLFEALTGSAEAADRAATSAADLSQEYLKLTGQTKELAAVKLSAQMVEDAAAVVLLAKELRELKDRRDDVVGSGAVLAPGLLKGFNKEINDVDNRMQALIAANEFRLKELNKFITTRQGDEQETEAPGGASGIAGSTFDQLVQKEIAALQLRGQLFNDSNATIEAEIMRFQLASLNLFEEGSDDFIAAEQALADKRIELHALADKKIADQTARATKQQENQLKAARLGAINGMIQLGDQLNNALAAAGKEGTAIAKAVFLAQKAIQVAQILAATEVAAAQAAAVAAIGGPTAFFATSAAIRAVGFASAGLVAGLAIGETLGGGRQFGGSTSPNLAHPINEAGIPEILNQGGKQFLLPTGQGGNITPLSGGAGGGMPNITIINEPGVTTEVESVTMEEVVFVAKRESKAAADRINTSLSTGRGESAQAVRSGFNIPRNIN